MIKTHMNRISLKVTCTKCKQSGMISIIENHDPMLKQKYIADWGNSKANNIISFRHRLDDKFGFECICGNYSILAKAEAGILIGEKPSKEDIKEVITRLNKEVRTTSNKVDGFKIEEV